MEFCLILQVGAKKGFDLMAVSNRFLKTSLCWNSNVTHHFVKFQKQYWKQVQIKAKYFKLEKVLFYNKNYSILVQIAFGYTFNQRAVHHIFIFISKHFFKIFFAFSNQYTYDIALQFAVFKEQDHYLWRECEQLNLDQV